MVRNLHDCKMRAHSCLVCRSPFMTASCATPVDARRHQSRSSPDLDEAVLLRPAPPLTWQATDPLACAGRGFLSMNMTCLLFCSSWFSGPGSSGAGAAVPEEEGGAASRAAAVHPQEFWVRMRVGRPPGRGWHVRRFRACCYRAIFGARSARREQTLTVNPKKSTRRVLTFAGEREARCQRARQLLSAAHPQ